MVGYENSSRSDSRSHEARCPECGSYRETNRSTSRGSESRSPTDDSRRRDFQDSERSRDSWSDRSAGGKTGGSHDRGESSTEAGSSQRSWDKDYSSRRLQDAFEQDGSQYGDRGGYEGSSGRTGNSSGSGSRSRNFGGFETSGRGEGASYRNRFDAGTSGYDSMSTSFDPTRWNRAVDRDFGGGAGWRGSETSGTDTGISHRGKGPKGYRRNDTTLHEEVCDRLTDDARIDASNIECKVSNGEVTLTGTVSTREEKRRAEDIAASVSGVHDVENKLKVQPAGTNSSSASSGTSAGSKSGSESQGTSAYGSSTSTMGSSSASSGSKSK